MARVADVPDVKLVVESAVVVDGLGVVVVEDVGLDVADDVVKAVDDVVGGSKVVGGALEVELVVDGGLTVVDEGLGTGTKEVAGVVGPLGKVAPGFVMTVKS